MAAGAVAITRYTRTRAGGAARAWALLLTSVAAFMVTLDALVVTTALPAMAADLGPGLGVREWVVNTYTLAFAAGIVPATALGDRFGRRTVFTCGLGLFTVASAACALAPGVGWVLAARALQGLGAGTVTPLGLTLLTAAFPAERRGAVLGLWGGLGGLAVASGPLIGAALTQALDWHWIFWINVPVGLGAAALAPIRLPESRGAPAPLDLPGLVLVTAAAGAGMAGLVRAAGTGWGAGAPLLAVGVGLTAIFVAVERRTAHPLLPPRLFRNRGFVPAATTWVLMTATISAATFFVAQFFQESQGDPPLAAGAHILPWTLAPLLVSPWAGALADRLGRRPVLAAGMLAQAAGLGWLALAAGTGTPYHRLVAPLVVAGLGIAAAMPVAVAATLSTVPPADLGKASGAASTLQRLGGGLGIALTAAVFTASGSLGGPQQFAAGFRPALAVTAGLSLLGVLTALRTRSGQADEVPAAGPSRVPSGTRSSASGADSPRGPGWTAAAPSTVLIKASPRRPTSCGAERPVCTTTEGGDRSASGGRDRPPGRIGGAAPGRGGAGARGPA